jgi:hypothetical protein
MRADRKAVPRKWAAGGLAGATMMLAGCGSLAELDDRGRAVTVIPAPLPGCIFVSSSYGRSHAREYALNNLRNQVGANGATHVVVTDETQLMQGFLPVGGNSLTLTGLGYKCPTVGATPAKR